MPERVARTALLEIVELADGDIVLQPAGGGGAEPLVRIRFSAESRSYLGDARLGVAKAMFEAGIRAAAAQAGEDAEVDEVPGANPGATRLH